MTIEHHKLMGGRLHIKKRKNSPYWQCETFLAGENRRISSREDSLALAKDFAEDWYLGLRGKLKNGELKKEKTFRHAADQFEREFPIITQGQRSPKYIARKSELIRLHLNPFLGNLGLSEVTAGKIQEYRVHRVSSSKTGKPPARSTIHHEIVTLRQILMTAKRHGWLAILPDLSEPYRTAGKIAHRAWFSPDEYKKLYEATRKRTQELEKKSRYGWEREQLHDYVLFMVNTGLRPDEAARLEFRDVEIVDDEATGETILVISVRGKRGVGYCKSTTGAVHPFERLRDRLRPVLIEPDPRAKPARGKAIEPKKQKPQPTDRLFPLTHRGLLNKILDEEKLKFDREGNRHTAYSLRHTYICLRLMEGADIYAIAKNCRTSVEMIEKYYATHIKTTLDAAAINVRRSKPKKKPNNDKKKRNDRKSKGRNGDLHPQ